MEARWMQITDDRYVDLNGSTGTTVAEPRFTPDADGADLEVIEDGHYPTGFA